MRKTLSIIIAILILLPIISISQDIPSSKRSRDAIKKVKPTLEKKADDFDLVLGDPVFIRIFKEEKELEVWIKQESGFILFKTYPICTYGSGDLGPKLKQGDGQAPIGFYYVRPNQLNPYSSYHLSFNLGYPNAYDRAHERTGSALMVHGDCVSIGCYAMTDDGIEEIYAIVDAALSGGQSFFRVHIFPFRMTEDNMLLHKDSGWYSFYENLKEGYDFFEENNNNPPNVKVRNKQYAFN
jgi:murein L,D-transpeptidase YafK